MKSVFCSLTLALFAFALSGAAQAQLPKIFVASTGNDANDGSRGSPKRNFQAAHDAVAAGGQIVVLDTAGYGTLNITKSLAITVPPGVNGFVTIPAGGQNDGITINATADDIVSLRGLIIEGGGPSAPSARFGVVATEIGTLNIDDCSLRSCTGAIRFTPSGGLGSLHIQRTTVRNNNTAIYIAPLAGAQARALITDCQLENNDDGVSCSTLLQSGTASVDATVVNCRIDGNSRTITASRGIVCVTQTANNPCVVRVDGCVITNLFAGIFGGSPGQVLSRGNNTLENNTSGNTFPGTYSPK